MCVLCDMCEGKCVTVRGGGERVSTSDVPSFPGEL